MVVACRVLLCVTAFISVSALPSGTTMQGNLMKPSSLPMRLRGGSSATKVAQSSSLSAIKEGAKRRAQLAKEALAKEPREKVSFLVAIWQGLNWVTNKLRITGHKTEVIKGKIVESRNPVQKLSLFIWNFFGGIGLFFRTLFEPAEGMVKKEEPEEGEEGEQYKRQFAGEWEGEEEGEGDAAGFA